MVDVALIAVRWSLYVDLGLLFGLPLFQLYALGDRDREALLPLRRLFVTLSTIGLVLSASGFLLVAATMMGTNIWGVDIPTLVMLLSETPMGWAILVRTGGLSAIVLLSCSPRATSEISHSIIIGLAAVIVASQAWFGHGAAGDGLTGNVQLTAAIVHLLAASAWLGALFGFLMILSRAHRLEASGLAVVHGALASFAGIGTIVVALILATGLLNAFLLIGIGNIPLLPQTRYGQLLILKLTLFAGMLLLAAGNRFRLTPALDAAIDEGSTEGAVSRLRLSLWLEAGAATAILAIIAWLGTLAPPTSLS